MAVDIIFLILGLLITIMPIPLFVPLLINFGERKSRDKNKYQKETNWREEQNLTFTCEPEDDSYDSCLANDSEESNALHLILEHRGITQDKTKVATFPFNRSYAHSNCKLLKQPLKKIHHHNNNVPPFIDGKQRLHKIVNIEPELARQISKDLDFSVVRNENLRKAMMLKYNKCAANNPQQHI